MVEVEAIFMLALPSGPALTSPRLTVIAPGAAPGAGQAPAWMWTECAPGVRPLTLIHTVTSLPFWMTSARRWAVEPLSHVTAADFWDLTLMSPHAITADAGPVDGPAWTCRAQFGT